MKNVKLTLATTLSVLTLAFSGAASAESGKHFDNHDHNNVIVKTMYSKDKRLKKVNAQKIRKQKVSNKVIVKRAPAKKVSQMKKLAKRSNKQSYSSNKRFKQVKTFKKQYSKYQSSKGKKTRYVRNARSNTKQSVRKSIYSVRSGDTLIQISYKTGVSIKKLARLNRIKNTDLNEDILYCEMLV